MNLKVALHTLLIAVVISLPNVATAAPELITDDNQNLFLQPAATQPYACKFDESSNSSSIGRLSTKSIELGTTTWNELAAKKTKKIRNRFKRKVSALRTRTKNASGKAKSKLKKKFKNSRAALKSFNSSRQTCLSFNPDMQPAPTATPTPTPIPGPTPTPTPGDTLAPFSAPFTWVPITFDGAVNMGHQPLELPEASQVAPGAVSLTDVTNAAGLSGAVGGGNQHGVGIAMIDLTGDGFEEIFVVNGTGDDSSLWLNDGDGTFTDISVSSGINAILNSGFDGYSIAGADYDADGDIDLYIGGHPSDILLQNQGNSTFVNVSVAAGAGGPTTAQSGTGSKVVSFGDFNGDGFQDLVSASFDIPGPGLYLLQNDGDGTFTDVTSGSGAAIASTGNPCAVLWTDYDNDSDKDLWIWNDRGGKVLLRNNGGSNFTNVTTAANMDAVQIGHPMGIDGADIDHDGDIDYYVSNVGNNPLLRNNGNGTFTDITGDAGAGGDFGWGLGFEDFNHDSWADIFVGQEDNLDYLVFTNLGIVPSMFSRIDVSHPNVEPGAAHNVAVAFGDYNRDGKTDVVTATTDGSRINLFRNDTSPGTQSWLEVDVPSAPDTMARGGVGARVIVKTGATVQFRDINGGSSRASQNAHTARFGLGQWTGAEWVAVLWPSGTHRVLLNVEGGQRVSIP